MALKVDHGERKRWRKRPVAVDAWQWDGGMDTASAIVGWITKAHPTGVARFTPSVYNGPDLVSPATIEIDTLEGTMTTSAGDFVIRGLEGEFYPCKASIFMASYEPV